MSPQLKKPEKNSGKKQGQVIPFAASESDLPPQGVPEAEHGLAARHLGKQYKRRPVLHDVSLTLQRGEVVGLLGPNGAGKTTCFYLLTGLVTPDTGMIVMDGMDITALPIPPCPPRPRLSAARSLNFSGTFGRGQYPRCT